MKSYENFSEELLCSSLTYFSLFLLFFFFFLVGWDTEPSVWDGLWDHVWRGWVPGCRGSGSSRRVPDSQPQLRARHPGGLLPGRRLPIGFLHVWPPGEHQGRCRWVCACVKSTRALSVRVFARPLSFFYVAATWREECKEMDFDDGQFFLLKLIHTFINIHSYLLRSCILCAACASIFNF